LQLDVSPVSPGFTDSSAMRRWAWAKIRSPVTSVATETLATYDVFISYARQDGSAHAERLEHDLSSAGFRTWRDKRDLDPDQDFTAVLEEAIERSRRIVCCITPDVRRSTSFVRREIGYALAKRRPVIPLVFADTLPPISIINNTQEDFTHVSWDQAIAALFARLRRADEQTDNLTTATSDPCSEYLHALYEDIVDYLRQTVFSEIVLFSGFAPGAVSRRTPRALPAAFSARAGVTSRSDREQSFASFHQAFHHFGGRVLLLGDPGAGKTTTLMAFARDMVAARLDNPELPLPVIAPIATWRDEPALLDWLVKQAPQLNADALRQSIDQGHTLLLLDGMDEIEGRGDRDQSANDRRRAFLDRLPRSGQVVVSSRRYEYENLGEQAPLTGAIILKPLTDDQVEQYLAGLPGLWAWLKSDAALLDALRTPMLLSFVAFALADLADGPTAPPDSTLFREYVFERYVMRRIEHERRKVSAAVELSRVYEVLGPVALASDLARQTDHIEAIVRARVPRADDDAIESLLTDLTLLHLVVRDRWGSVRFMHLLLRDHFARWHQRHKPDWKLEMLDVLGRLCSAGALNVITGWFDDPEVGPRAEQAAWRYFHDAPGGLRSSVRIALDAWEAYKDRHGGS